MRHQSYKEAYLNRLLLRPTYMIEHAGRRGISLMEYIKAHTQPKDGKLVAVGHSMGGILLYSMLSRLGSEGRGPGLAAIVTLASSLDYRSSKSSLKLLLPLADTAHILNVPIVALGALLIAAFPLTSRPPYVLSWLNHMISAQNMMDPELLKKFVLNNFCGGRSVSLCSPISKSS